jgi:hypothetical protein
VLQATGIARRRFNSAAGPPLTLLTVAGAMVFGNNTLVQFSLSSASYNARVQSISASGARSHDGGVNGAAAPLAHRRSPRPWGRCGCAVAVDLCIDDCD